jgi:hypothetical protein
MSMDGDYDISSSCCNTGSAGRIVELLQRIESLEGHLEGCWQALRDAQAAWALSQMASSEMVEPEVSERG